MSSDPRMRPSSRYFGGRRDAASTLARLGPRLEVPLPLQRTGAAYQEHLIARGRVALQGEGGGFLDGHEEGVEGGGGDRAHSERLGSSGEGRSSSSGSMPRSCW